MATSPSQFMVRFQDAGKWGAPHDLVNARYSFGRGVVDDPGAVDFVRPHDGVLSRLHCYLVRAGDSYAVQNESKNGTCVNGRLISGPQGLKHRDTIEMGDHTVIQFLIVDAEERRRLLGEHVGSPPAPGSGSGAAVVAGSSARKKGKLLHYVLGFYALLGLVVLALLNAPGDEVADPGPGPYFADLFDAPFAGSGGEDDGPRPQSFHISLQTRDALWSESRKRYDGPLRALPGHRWRLLSEALRLLRLEGRYPSGVLAAKAGDTLALAAAAARNELNEKLARLYKDALAREAGGLRAEAAAVWRALVAEVPDHTQPIHRYAVWRLQELRAASEE